jgi:hypothetical protein
MLATRLWMLDIQRLLLYFDCHEAKTRLAAQSCTLRPPLPQRFDTTERRLATLLSNTCCARAPARPGDVRHVAFIPSQLPQSVLRLQVYLDAALAGPMLRGCPCSAARFQVRAAAAGVISVRRST